MRTLVHQVERDSARSERDQMQQERDAARADRDKSLADVARLTQEAAASRARIEELTRQLAVVPPDAPADAGAPGS